MTKTDHNTSVFAVSCPIPAVCHADGSSRIVNAVIAAVATLLLLQLGAILFRHTRHRE